MLEAAAPHISALTGDPGVPAEPVHVADWPKAVICLYAKRGNVAGTWPDFRTQPYHTSAG